MNNGLFIIHCRDSHFSRKTKRTRRPSSGSNVRLVRNKEEAMVSRESHESQVRHEVSIRD